MHSPIPLDVSRRKTSADRKAVSPRLNLVIRHDGWPTYRKPMTLKKIKLNTNGGVSDFFSAGMKKREVGKVYYPYSGLIHCACT